MVRPFIIFLLENFWGIPLFEENIMVRPFIIFLLENFWGIPLFEENIMVHPFNYFAQIFPGESPFLRKI